MTTTAIAAIVVNYNAGDELTQALRSIAADLAGTPWEAIVVDNASTDGSADRADEFGPPVRVMRNAKNVGFGQAVNQALATTNAPLVLIMNPDCRLIPGAVETLSAVLAAHESCALVGPRILDPDGAVQGSARGDPDMLTGLFGRTTALRRLFPNLAPSTRNVVAPADIVPGENSKVVDWLSGACMLARRASLEAASGFDAGYFLYWEDADLCRRLRALGQHVRYVPGATAVHRVGHSSRTVRKTAVRAFHESAYRYYATHVAPGPFDPRRPLARALLAVRCWLTLRRAADRP